MLTNNGGKMITIEVNENELYFLLQGIDLKLGTYAKKKDRDYIYKLPEWKVKKILELKTLRDKVNKEVEFFKKYNKQ